MDVKTMLLLGIGMAVLLLLGFCVAPSRSAGFRPGQQWPSVPGVMPQEKHTWIGRNRQSDNQLFEAGGRRLFVAVEQPAMLVGLEG